MVRKNKAFEEQGAALGHNKGPGQEEQYKITVKVFELMGKKKKIDDEIKELLNKGKDAGFLKTPIRKVASEMHKAEDAMQAKREVERETQRLRAYVADKDGQYDFLIATGED